MDKYTVLEADKLRSDQYHGSVEMHLWELKLVNDKGINLSGVYWTHSNRERIIGRKVTLSESMGEISFKIVE